MTSTIRRTMSARTREGDFSGLRGRRGMVWTASECIATESEGQLARKVRTRFRRVPKAGDRRYT